MILRYSLFGCVLFCWACTNIENAKPSDRNTFIRFYEAPHNIYGISAEPVDNGFAILGNETLASGQKNIILIRTDKNGERIADDIVLTGGISNSMKVTSEGYYIIGDSIKTNLESSDVADLEIYSARLFKLSPTGAVMKRLVIADHINTSKITDIHGNAVTFNAQGNILLLGTFKEAAQTEKAYVSSFNPLTFDTLWSKQYDILGRNYKNSNSIHTNSLGKIVWASDLVIENQTLSKSYLTIPYIDENSTFLNYAQYGEKTDQNITVADIQPANSAAFGFGVIGTYASINNDGSNVFFILVDQYGDVVPGSERFFDGETLNNSNQSVNADVSLSDDSGNAIAATSDGGFIIGASTASKQGNGGKNILLIKVDGTGNVLWNKIIGGAGDEVVNSIRETSDGGYLICGSNDLLGLSSIFLIRTDINGELKD